LCFSNLHITPSINIYISRLTTRDEADFTSQGVNLKSDPAVMCLLYYTKDP